MKVLNFLLLVVITSAVVNAQNPPAFEVASVKLNNTRPPGPLGSTLGCHGTDSNSPGTNIPAGRCIAKFQPLRLVIALAYDIPPASMYPYQGEVLSGPSWINTDMYDIEAKAESPATEAQLKQMLQALLADRFKLKMHRESKEMPIYALVMSKDGHKLQPAEKDRECGDQRRRDHRYELSADSLTGHCHAFIPGGQEHMILGQSVDMNDFAEMLSIWAGRLVVNKTPIDGLFDIKMPRFSNAQLNAPLSAQPERGGIPGGAIDIGRERFLEAQAAMPTLSNVLDRMGLKLEATKGPVEVLVIDSVQKPTEN